MPLYRRKPVKVDAVQWFPDPKFGKYDGKKYVNKTVGSDRHGVEYTVTQSGMWTGVGYSMITPGDWILTDGSGKRWVVEADEFHKLYERAEE